jgi:hypothetical protein
LSLHASNQDTKYSWSSRQFFAQSFVDSSNRIKVSFAPSPLCRDKAPHGSALSVLKVDLGICRKEPAFQIILVDCVWDWQNAFFQICRAGHGPSNISKRQLVPIWAPTPPPSSTRKKDTQCYSTQCHPPQPYRRQSTANTSFLHWTSWCESGDG